jgi:hypothetical protein
VAPLRAAHELHHDGSLEPVPDYLGEAWLSRGSGTTGPLRPSVNRLTVAVSTRGPARVVLNQNHHPGWTPSAGRAGSEDGLLAVDLDAAFEGDLELTFRPRSIRLGAVISASAAGGFVALWLLVRRREWLRE